MRNLVALQRRVWTLEADNLSSDACVAFASIPGESQAFFLRASGRIDVLQPEEDDAQLSDQELQLFLDLNEFVEPQEGQRDTGGHWKWMQYVAELGMLVCASSSGALVTVDVDAIDGEEVGTVDSGLRAVAWSGNQEMLALVTGAGRLLVMSNDWEVLHETEIEASLPSGLVLCADENHWKCEVCWREDSQFIAVNIATMTNSSGATGGNAVVQKVLVFTAQLELHALGRLEDGREIGGLVSALDWSQSMALIASSETRKSRRLFVVFFERNGLRHGDFEIPRPYRAPTYHVAEVRWNAASDILAVRLKPTSSAKLDDNDNDLGSVVQLWTRNNYHWYLKQELQFRVEEELVDFAWDEEVAGRLSILTRSSVTQALTFYEHDFAWDICGVETERPQLGLSPSHEQAENVSPQCQSLAVTGVIDGSRLLLTPLHRAMIPPPFALLQATFDAAINSVVFDSQSETLLVLLSTGTLVLVENYLSPRDGHTSAAGLPPPLIMTARPQLPLSITTVRLPVSVNDSESFALGSLFWVHFCSESRRLYFAGKSEQQDQLIICSVTCVSAADADEETVTVRQTGLLHVKRVCKIFRTSSKDKGLIVFEEPFAMLAVQIHSGAVYTMSVLEPSALVRIPGNFPPFSHLTVIGCGDIDKQGNRSREGIVVIGLDSSSARLFVNDELLASACSSFRYCALPSVLLFTTQGRESQLCMAPLTALQSYCKDAGADSVTLESRSIERGALLVATIGQRANVIVQMPRGNLECIAPRLLVLLLVIQHIKERDYVAALEICRRHRLDLNILVDFDPQGFLESFSRCLVKQFLSSRPAAVTSDRLCLFITNLHPVDVWTTKYGPLLAPFSHAEECQSSLEENGETYTSEGKVNMVCQAFMQAIKEQERSGDDDESALLLPFVTSAVKQSPARFDEALGKVQMLLHGTEHVNGENTQHRPAATRAIKHLIMLTDVDSLYSEALGLYDLDLVRTVATHSQRDPKEYVPFLDRVAQLENEHWRKYTIDLHLGRHERALAHLSALICDASDEDELEKSKLQGMAMELIKQGGLYDQGTKLFPFTAVKRSVSDSTQAFHRQILLLKGDHLESAKKYEAAAYVYLAASDQDKARRAFLAANKWQMALALSARNQENPDKLRNEAYAIAEELLNRQQQQQGGSIDDILAAARIYVEYCNDIDEAVSLLVTHQQWAEALRVAYLHKREDLVESDVETGVLQSCDDILEELKRNEKAYAKHWKRLTTIREQKRLFKLHGIDGSRWDHGSGDADAASIRSGASSAADSALSNVSKSSVGSHNSAASIGNFSMQSLSAATASHFYATQALGDAGKKPKSKTKHGGMPSRRERRKRMKEGSAEEEAYVAQQLSELRPSAALARDVGALLEMLIFFGHIQQAQKLQTQLAGFEQSVATKTVPLSTDELPDTNANEVKVDEGKDATYPQWCLEALQG